MIKIEVKDREVTERKFTTKDGRPMHFREQTAWAFLVDEYGKPHPYPSRINLSLGDDQQPYDLGAYTIDPGSLFVNRYSSLQLGRLNLRPLTQPAAKVA